MRYIKKTLFRLVNIIPAIGGLLVLCLGLVAGDQVAWAQSSSDTKTAKFGRGGQQIPFGEDNQYLHDLLRLQTQIDLLSHLRNRQDSINAMAEHYSKIGVPFVPPAPSRSICQEIPPNVLCAEHYPDLYPGFMNKFQSSESQPLPRLDQLPIVQRIDEVEESQKEELKEISFVWTDISCMNGVCEAVIMPDIPDTVARYTIEQGDQLPSGETITGISSKGIEMLSSDGQSMRLEPAPTGQ